MERRFAFALALHMRCTVAELGKRLSSQEFSEWQVFFDVEQLHPVDARHRHAELLAATFTGAAVRRDKRPWGAPDFYESAPWRLLLNPQPADPDLTPEPDIDAHVAAMNARLH